MPTPPAPAASRRRRWRPAWQLLMAGSLLVAGFVAGDGLRQRRSRQARLPRSPRLVAPPSAADAATIVEVWIDPDHLRLQLPGRCEELALMPLATPSGPQRRPWFRRYLRGAAP